MKNSEQLFCRTFSEEIPESESEKELLVSHSKRAHPKKLKVNLYGVPTKTSAEDVACAVEKLKKAREDFLLYINFLKHSFFAYITFLF